MAIETAASSIAKPLRRLPASYGGGERLVDDQPFEQPPGRAGVGFGQQVGRVKQERTRVFCFRDWVGE